MPNIPNFMWVLIVVLVLFAIFGHPGMGYGQRYYSGYNSGYYGGGIGGLLLLLIVLWLLGVFR